MKVEGSRLRVKGSRFQGSSRTWQKIMYDVFPRFAFGSSSLPPSPPSLRHTLIVAGPKEREQIGREGGVGIGNERRKTKRGSAMKRRKTKHVLG